MKKQFKQIQTIHLVILAIITFLTILLIITPIILFIMTKNTYTLLPTAGLLPVTYAWKRILLYFFPKEQQDYELEKTKILAKSLSRQRVLKP